MKPVRLAGPRYILFLLVLSFLSPNSFGQFKAKYYPQCYEPLQAAREEVPVPPVDIQKSLNTAGKVAGIAGRLGGLGGFGGFGGGAANAVQTVQTVNQYSGLIADVAAFTAAMQEEFPELGLRLSAYGGRLDEDADLLLSAGRNITTAQDCYREAYDDLSAAYAAGDMKRREVNRQHREIEKGLAFADTILVDAGVRLNKNIESYNSALQQETEGAGIKLGALAGLVSSNAVMDQLSSAISPSMLSACNNISAFNAASEGCAQLTGASGDLCPSGNCSLSEMRARASQQQLANLQDGENSSQQNYGVMQELSAIGLMGVGQAGAVGAAAILSNALAAGQNGGTSETADLEIEEGVLQGLVEAGAMSSRYLMVNNGFQEAVSRQEELMSYTADSPTRR